jgi:uroporphyrin-III C-methyltransferase
MKRTGKVFIVGAGPGDPELLTLKAHRLLTTADAVIYDRLISQDVLDLMPAGAIRLYVGKAANEHSTDQNQIHELMVALAKSGKQVVRLKGGDPFTFGRGGEEVEYLISKNIPFEVVPGVTSASGCSSYAGIPLTHRDYASSVRFITGHFKEGKEEWDWSECVNPRTTLVVYMGLNKAGYIAKKLLENGSRIDIPVAVIEQGTQQKQRTVITNLAALQDTIDSHAIQSPGLIIVGDVVKLATNLSWFTQPLLSDASSPPLQPQSRTEARPAGKARRLSV